MGYNEWLKKKKEEEEEQESAGYNNWLKKHATEHAEEAKRESFASSYDSFLKSYNDYAGYVQSVENSGNVSPTAATTARYLADYATKYQNYFGQSEANKISKYIGDSYEATQNLGFYKKYLGTTHKQRQEYLTGLKQQISGLNDVLKTGKASDTEMQSRADLVNEYKYLLDYDNQTTTFSEAANERAEEDAARVKRMEELRAQGAKDESALGGIVKDIAKVASNWLSPGSGNTMEALDQLSADPIQAEYNELMARHLNYVRNQLPSDQAIGAYYDTTDYGMLQQAQGQGD